MRYTRDPKVLWRSTSCGPVLQVRNDAPTRLGGLAAVVWEVLDSPLSADAVAEAVQDVLGEGQDVSKALQLLEMAGLLSEQ